MSRPQPPPSSEYVLARWEGRWGVLGPEKRDEFLSSPLWTEILQHPWNQVRDVVLEHSELEAIIRRLQTMANPTPPSAGARSSDETTPDSRPTTPIVLSPYQQGIWDARQEKWHRKKEKEEWNELRRAEERHKVEFRADEIRKRLRTQGEERRESEQRVKEKALEATRRVANYEKKKGQPGKGRCPICRNAGLPVLFRSPSSEVQRAAEQGLVVLGGCIVRGDEDSTWWCPLCEESFNGAVDINVAIEWTLENEVS